MKIIDCVSHIVAIEVLLAAQALEMRKKGLSWSKDGTKHKGEPVVLAPRVDVLFNRVRSVIGYWNDDNLLHPDIDAARKLKQEGAFIDDHRKW